MKTKFVTTPDDFHGNYPDSKVQVQMIDETQNPNPQHQGFRVIVSGNDDYGWAVTLPRRQLAVCLYDRIVDGVTIAWLQEMTLEPW